VQLVWPVPELYWPTEQLVQMAEPDDAVIRPTAQLTHAAAPAKEYFPAAQDEHAKEVAADAARNLPATQAVHTTDPAVAWKKPAAQSEQLVA
jgi:hypothetical protein